MKKVFVHPADAVGHYAELKAFAALYDFTLEFSMICPRGQMMVFDYDDERWMRYDESRRGRYLPGEQLGTENI
jgi:hypothetical protein